MNSNEYQDILDRLKACRITAGFSSARAFSKSFSIPEKTYYQHESGQRKIPIDSLVDYSNYLKINSHWLILGQGFPSDSSAINDAVIEFIFDQYNQKVIFPKIKTGEKCLIDTELLTKTLAKLIDVVTKNNIQIECTDLVEFAYSIYNSIIDTTTDEQTRNNLIDLATKSLLTGTKTVKIDKQKIS